MIKLSISHAAFSNMSMHDTIYNNSSVIFILIFNGLN
jgi:hypothetical protein